MNKNPSVFFFVFFVFSVSCSGGGGGGDLSGNVVVIPLPYGRGDVIQSRRPRATYSVRRETVPCRREHPNLRSIQDIPGLSVIADLLLGDLEEGEEGAEQGRNLREPVNVDVSGAWIKLGLLIQNQNTGVGRNQTLVVDRLDYFVDGQCEREGQPPCKTQNTIPPGYCVLPFLYLVPAGNQVEYKPLSNNPLHNLTVYLDQLPVIDKTQETAAEGKSPLPGGVSFILPQYKITMVLIGSFLLEDGTTYEHFQKTIRFKTTARRAY